MKNSRARARFLRGVSLTQAVSRRGVFAEQLEIRRLLTTYTVNSAADIASPPTGTVTLRSAITAVNADTGPDAIDFNIPGGAATIAITSALPAITTPVTIDGTSQPGYAGTPLITLDGSAAGPMVAGLEISGGSSTVQGLRIQNIVASGFTTVGFAIVTDTKDSDIVQNCVLVLNGGGIDWEVHGTSFIQNNYIGTDSAGDTGLGNSGDGIDFGYIYENGASAEILNNVISGNTGNGFQNPEPAFADASATFQGNIIGLNPSGTAALPNGGNGLELQSGLGGLIGGITPAQRNIISGNTGDGINVNGPTDVTIIGNYIGTDITGSVEIQNVNTGVNNSSGGSGILGGTAPGDANVICGGVDSVLVDNGFMNIEGNFIGTNATGQVALPGNIGVEIDGETDFVLGGSAPGAGNVISGDFYQGVEIGKDSSNVTLQGNKIGTNAAGTAVIGGGYTGIYVIGSNNLIGGSVLADANDIAGYTVGVQLRFGTGNALRLNSIFGNGVGGSGSGVAFGNNGPADFGDNTQPIPNDPGDTDTGANNQQNYPVLASAVSSAAGTTIQGLLNSNPNTPFIVDFYSNAALDASGLGEGQTYLGSLALTTDSSGNALFNPTLPATIAAGSYVTAIATNATLSPYGDSSEFSPAVQATAPVVVVVKPTISIGNVSQNEGNTGTTTFAFPVTLSNASSTPITVSYATADGTAKVSDNDYLAASSTLTIPAGSTSGVIDVSVVGDTKYEPNETFTVALSNPSGAVLGTATGTGTILNDDSIPTISIGSVSQNEGNSGTTTFAFPVTLSNASSTAITVHYATADGTAKVSDNDYLAASSTLTIPAGSTSGVIDVSVVGDTKYEPNETFTVTLSSPSGATLASTSAATATGTILNDDSLPSISIGDVSQNEGNSGTTTFAFPVTLSNPSATAITVHYATADGTATTSDHDYTATSGTLTIPAGATTATINVSVIGDTKVESNETFTVTLSSPSGATISRATATGTIINDDVPPPTLFSAHVNFEPAGVAVPAGYVADTGAVYGSRSNGLTYGWNANDSANAHVRHVNSNPLLDSFIFMQQNGNYSWSIAVPNGTYTVHAVAGDPSSSFGNYQIAVDGTLTVSESPTRSNPFVQGTKTISVTSGKIIVTNAAGAFNDALCYIDITETAAAPVVTTTAKSTAVFPASNTPIVAALLTPASDVLTRIST